MDRIDAASRLARGVLPGPLFQCARRVGTAVLTPWHFTLRSGHFRSSLLSQAVGRDGRPRPWYTIPLVELLCTKDFSHARVLEWGAGQSTLWWAERAESVVAFETDPTWHARLAQERVANLTLHLVSSTLDGVEARLDGEDPFDVIVIDGKERLMTAHLSHDRLTPTGCVIQDNSEGYWGGEADHSHPIVDHFREQGFQRVDFFGFALGGIKPTCTSVYFRARCFLFEGGDPPRLS